MMTKHRPIIVDECVSPKITRYLEESGEEVIHIQDGRPDGSIIALAHKLNNAYILTRNWKDFKHYQNAVRVDPKERPEGVYRKLRGMMV
jgi:predicted nuclease of predicted toxin-antitoxin system